MITSCMIMLNKIVKNATSNVTESNNWGFCQGGFVQGDIVQGVLSGGFVQGGYVPGGFW